MNYREIVDRKKPYMNVALAGGYTQFWKLLWLMMLLLVKLRKLDLIRNCLLDKAVDDAALKLNEQPYD